ncbi:hypothetical protein DFJ74DRAFT_701658 [Hyaloraphidium curvatum]|nr:hypothetical protein DFJ74DRAFT_701658 [Hyaloraphidium curvatum]
MSERRKLHQTHAADVFHSLERTWVTSVAATYMAVGTRLKTLAVWTRGPPQGSHAFMDTMQDLDPEFHSPLPLNVDLLLYRKSDCLSSVYTLRVRIMDTDPSIWSKVHGSAPLHHLHSFIAVSFGWALLYHQQYKFVLPDYFESFHNFKSTMDAVFTFGFPALDAMHVRLGQAVREKGTVFHYVYDLGIGWVHEIEVVDIEKNHEEKVNWIPTVANASNNFAHVKWVKDYKSRRLTGAEIMKIADEMNRKNEELLTRQMELNKGRGKRKEDKKPSKAAGSTAPLWDFETFEPRVRNIFLEGSVAVDRKLLPNPSPLDLDPKKAPLCPIIAMPAGTAFREHTRTRGFLDRMAFSHDTLRRSFEGVPVEHRVAFAVQHILREKGRMPDAREMVEIEARADPKPMEGAPFRFPQVFYPLATCSGCGKAEGRVLGDVKDKVALTKKSDIDKVTYEILDTKLAICSRCRKAFYCSSDCQRKHWPTHKPDCVKPTKAT